MQKEECDTFAPWCKLCEDSIIILIINKWLRTVPAFVSVHMFCASRKPWFKRMHAVVDVDAINYATKHTTKIKAKFSYCDQINFNVPVLKPGKPE